MERFYKMVEASNKRFPDGVEPFQMAIRLLEECGEVASEINLWEGSGLKRQKHGEPKKQDILYYNFSSVNFLINIRSFVMRLY